VSLAGGRFLAFRNHPASDRFLAWLSGHRALSSSLSNDGRSIGDSAKLPVASALGSRRSAAAFEVPAKPPTTRRGSGRFMNGARACSSCTRELRRSEVHAEPGEESLELRDVSTTAMK
jgi:hypothetical protein